MHENLIDDELRLAQLEGIQLRETISVLRAELETQHFEKDQGIQQALADSAREAGLEF